MRPLPLVEVAPMESVSDDFRDYYNLDSYLFDKVGPRFGNDPGGRAPAL